MADKRGKKEEQEKQRGSDANPADTEFKSTSGDIPWSQKAIQWMGDIVREGERGGASGVIQGHNNGNHKPVVPLPRLPAMGGMPVIP